MERQQRMLKERCRKDRSALVHVAHYFSRTFSAWACLSTLLLSSTSAATEQCLFSDGLRAIFWCGLVTL